MKKVLIIIDYQVDFVDGALPCGDSAIKIEKNIYDKINNYKKEGQPVIFTFDTHIENEYHHSIESKKFPIHCVKESNGWDLYGKVDDLLDGHEKLIMKETYGSFKLLDYLSDKLSMEDEIEVIGIATNICVLHNVILLYNKFPNNKIIVDASCCASFDSDLHESALNIMEGIGIEIINR